MAVSYNLDLNLPTDPGLPPGPEYDEFRAIYAALRQLQDGVSLAAGLVTYDQESLAGLAPLDTYLIGGQAVLIFEATTNISIGGLVEGVAVGTELKVKQPAALALDGGGFPKWDHYVGLPLFSCLAGQHVAVATRYGVAPFPGAISGYGYHLDPSFAVVRTLGFTPGFFLSDGVEAVGYNVGYCIEENKLILNLSGAYYT